MNTLSILQFLFLLVVANGVPVIIAKLLGQFANHPLDGRRKFYDGRNIFGPSKTIRGFVGAIVFTPIVTMFLGWSFIVGLYIAVGAMLGDLISSFLKRRLGLPSSSMALGLDQVPESLIPALLCMNALAFGVLDIAIIVVAFFVGELILSRFLYWLKIRKTPY